MLLSWQVIRSCVTKPAASQHCLPQAVRFLLIAQQHHFMQHVLDLSMQISYRHVMANSALSASTGKRACMRSHADDARMLSHPFSVDASNPAGQGCICPCQGANISKYVRPQASRSYQNFQTTSLPGITASWIWSNRKRHSTQC